MLKIETNEGRTTICAKGTLAEIETDIVIAVKSIGKTIKNDDAKEAFDSFIKEELADAYFSDAPTEDSQDKLIRLLKDLLRKIEDDAE